MIVNSSSKFVIRVAADDLLWGIYEDISTVLWREKFVPCFEGIGSLCSDVIYKDIQFSLM